MLIGDIVEFNLSTVNFAIDGTPGYFEPEEEKTYDFQGFRSLGNHDYHILQALNTSEREIKPLQKGQLLDPDYA